jgi:uncharacterized protein
MGVTSPSRSSGAVDPPDLVLSRTRQWIERAVIGLNLCPFARAVYVRDQIRMVVSPARTEEQLLVELQNELLRLQQTPPEQIDTTLLIHPEVLTRFEDFNEFLGPAEKVLRQSGLEGEIQIASFHPQYQFVGTEADDITNYTNRAPYPILHLLREASVSRAVASVPDPGAIVDANLETLRNLGHRGWQRLGLSSGPTET